MRFVVFTSMWLLIVVMLPSNSTGQVPGYLGKRYLFSYDGKFFPSLYKYTNDPAKGNPVINATHQFQAEYVLSQKKTLGVAFQYAKNRFDLTGANVPAPANVAEGIVDYKAGSIIYKSFFRDKGFIAPLGSYFHAELALGKVTYRPSDDDLEGIDEFTGDFWAPSLGAGYGKHFIVWDKMLIDIGFEMLAPVNFITVMTESTPFMDNTPNDREALKRMYRHLIFNLHVGIGFVGF